MINEAVLDAGPLIHLEQIEKLEVLDVIRNILIPQEVAEEFGKMNSLKVEVKTLKPESKDRTKYLTERHGIELGEASAISLARQEDVKYFFTDDLEARKTAEKLDLEPHGTLALVTRAYREEIVNQAEAEETIEKLYQESSLFLTRDLANWALQKIRTYSG